MSLSVLDMTWLLCFQTLLFVDGMLSFQITTLCCWFSISPARPKQPSSWSLQLEVTTCKCAINIFSASIVPTTPPLKILGFVGAMPYRYQPYSRWLYHSSEAQNPALFKYWPRAAVVLFWGWAGVSYLACKINVFLSRHYVFRQIKIFRWETILRYKTSADYIWDTLLGACSSRDQWHWMYETQK